MSMAMALDDSYYEVYQFDTVNYIQKLRKAGVNQEAAEVQAQELQHFQNSVLAKSEQKTQQLIDLKAIVTNGDLERVNLSLKKDIETVNLSLKKDIETVNLSLKKDIETVNLSLQKEIEVVRKDIEKAKNQTLMLMGTFGIFFLGVIAKGFHWI